MYFYTCMYSNNITISHETYNYNITGQSNMNAIAIKYGNLSIQLFFNCHTDQQPHRYHNVIFKLNTEIVDTRGKQITNGKRLSELIEMSLEDFPREYLLCNLTDEEGLGPMTASSFSNSLKIIFKPRVPSQNMLRKAYVNYIYNSPDFKYIPYSFLQTVASSMRHTVETAMKKYRKSNAPDDILPDAGPLHDVKIVRTINIPVVVEKKRKSMALIAKNYREKNKDKVIESRKTYYTNNKDAILKRKIINNLNSQAQTQVQKRTIAKYDLKQDPITGEWS